MSESVPHQSQRDPASSLATTTDLIRHYKQTSNLAPELLEVAIPAAIDALYANRDAGGNMHSAGAAAGEAALRAVDAWERLHA